MPRGATNAHQVGTNDSIVLPTTKVKAALVEVIERRFTAPTTAIASITPARYPMAYCTRRSPRCIHRSDPAGAPTVFSTAKSRTRESIAEETSDVSPIQMIMNMNVDTAMSTMPQICDPSIRDNKLVSDQSETVRLTPRLARFYSIAERAALVCGASTSTVLLRFRSEYSDCASVPQSTITQLS